MHAHPRSRPIPPRALALAGGLLALFGASEARAQDFEGVRLLGYGGARRALGTANEALYSNPAGLAFGKVYEVELSYGDDLRESDRQINASIADGQAGDVAGGLAVTYGRFRPPELAGGERRLEGLRVDLASAVPLGRTFALGASTRFADYRLLDGDEEVEGGGSSGFAFDLGLQWMVLDNVFLGVVLQNFTAQEQPGMPRAWGAGLGYRGEAFTIEVDIDHVWESAEPFWTLSADYTIADKVPLRAAVTFDQATQDFTLSVGAGVQVDRFAFDVGYRQTIAPSGEGDDADGRLLVASVRAFVF